MFGVRYIAINGNVDTDSSESNDLMPFKNLFKNTHRMRRGFQTSQNRQVRAT
ncbi:hypothetical protein SAMN05216343_11229 [Oscillibacter sp. PC13]|uniref:hypothetical protein n=1 Tax=Oscillibacter sp. PC13 TaxID=1855299 RepID=UPI0008E9D41E|nr:hypothetical protein [Oscillibacter sp. PC13]SFP68742.1 hypothetical protein SAMN05216343_11229 [Oscillibacter sp. PC13]